MSKEVEARLRQEIAEYADLTGRLTRLLTLTANALKGDPPDHVLHDWSDLPEVARLLKALLTIENEFKEIPPQVTAVYSTSDREERGRLFRHLRESRGLTRLEVARYLGIDRSQLSRWETGETTPSERIRKRLSSIYLSEEEL